jgi:hypothetical protein
MYTGSLDYLYIVKYMRELLGKNFIKKVSSEA